MGQRRRLSLTDLAPVGSILVGGENVTEIHRILDQMDRAYGGDAWHGPSLIAVLDGISAEDASTHAVPGAHSVWEIVNHIAAWHSIVEKRLNGETVEVTVERDWPTVWEVSDVAWRRALENLAESRARLRALIEGLQDAQLNEKPATGNDSRYVVLHGVIQHDLYHGGQIAILKKAFQSKFVAAKTPA
jgi:uncharacterized damage-inducible protein DinB